ncbi:MAG: YbaN family protein [Rhodospirillales bacterium]|nr:YbaN family protein [Rhodospirillales bacterium]
MKTVDSRQDTPDADTIPASPRGWRVVFFLLGWIFFGLGAVGAFLPVLPTTPFMILALWAFARSSRRFHDWLYNHRIFGPPLQRWSEHRVVPLHAKVAAVTAMVASLVYLIWFSDVPGYAIVLTALVMAGAAAYVLTRPSRAPG